MHVNSYLQGGVYSNEKDQFDYSPKDIGLLGIIIKH